MEKNIHGQDTGMNCANAFNAAEPLLFTPKAMDALEKSIALLMSDAKAFAKGQPDYYRYLCLACTDNLLLRVGALWQAGKSSAGLRPKSAEPGADDSRACIEDCYSEVRIIHGLLWKLYDFNAYSDCTRAELEDLAKMVLLATRVCTIDLAGAASCFLLAYKVPKDFVSLLPEAHTAAFYLYDGTLEACQDKAPGQAEAWTEKLDLDIATSAEMLSAYFGI